VGDPLPKLRKGVIISAISGKAVEYGLRVLKDHGPAFVVPGRSVYEGMIVGANNKEGDLEINVCKEKNLTNHRSKSHQGP
jgi:GTP-binding protein